MDRWLSDLHALAEGMGACVAEDVAQEHRAWEQVVLRHTGACEELDADMAASQARIDQCHARTAQLEELGRQELASVTQLRDTVEQLTREVQQKEHELEEAREEDQRVETVPLLGYAVPVAVSTLVYSMLEIPTLVVMELLHPGTVSWKHAIHTIAEPVPETPVAHRHYTFGMSVPPHQSNACVISVRTHETEDPCSIQAPAPATGTVEVELCEKDPRGLESELTFCEAAMHGHKGNLRAEAGITRALEALRYSEALDHKYRLEYEQLHDHIAVQCRAELADTRVQHSSDAHTLMFLAQEHRQVQGAVDSARQELLEYRKSTEEYMDTHRRRVQELETRYRDMDLTKMKSDLRAQVKVLAQEVRDLRL